MEDGSRLGRKVDSMLVENTAWALDVVNQDGSLYKYPI